MSHSHATRPRCAVYVRMSTPDQKDSPERQRSQVLPYLERRGYRLVGEYEDLGVRGHEFEKREGFQRLLKDARAGKFDVIVVDELSRLSRQEVVEYIVSV